MNTFTKWCVFDPIYLAPCSYLLQLWCDQVAGTPGTVVLIHTDTGLSLSLVTNMLTALVVSGLVATAAAQYAGCPEPYGLQVYPHEQYFDKFYKCANGKYYTFDY